MLEPAATPPLLSCRDVTVRFGGLTAVSAVDLDVHEGEIVGLIGPNGAGKTTLMECISGFQPVAAGTISFEGTDLLVLPADRRARLGIGRTLQDARLFPHLTVRDNVRIALHRHGQVGVLAHALMLPTARFQRARSIEWVEEMLYLVGMRHVADTRASDLSFGMLRLLELACMLALEPRLLLLDEPASGLSQKETEALDPLLRRIRQRTGATILMIEHDMPLVMGLADRVVCLDAGRAIATGTPTEVQEHPDVVDAYLGAPMTRQPSATVRPRGPAPDPATPTPDVLLEVRGLDVHYGPVQVLEGVDLDVRRGERIALLGTNGAGKSTVLKAVSGLVPPSAGTIRWRGEDVVGVSAERLVRAGIGHVPGGRGMFPSLTVGETLRMGGFILPEGEVAEGVERAVHRFPWFAERMDQLAGTLSGGQQQQLAIGRALVARPQLLMIDELSLGLAPLVIEDLLETVGCLVEEEGLTVVMVEQQATMALAHTDRAYFLEKGQVRYAGDSAGLMDRPDLLRSVFLAAAQGAGPTTVTATGVGA